VLTSFYIVLTIVFCGILNKGTSETLSEGFQQGYERQQMSIVGVFNSLPLIIFSFMYQINIPAIYTELNV
jgi:amino acid permease